MADPRLCLVMIVKDEAARIERCLASVKPWISCWSITDTVSTNGTQNKIRDLLAGIPGYVTEEPFVNFAQARNLALVHARVLGTDCDYDYMLLVDADMELVVEDDDWLVKIPTRINGKEDAADDTLGILRSPSGPGAFYMEQRGGSLAYWNLRLLQRDAAAHYVGVTHEYLSIEGPAGRIGGAWFRDHMDGANRAGKLQRDINLLTEDIARDPQNPRSWFYLAQSYRDAGRQSDAMDAYLKRDSLGGWAEERAQAVLEAARCADRLADGEAIHLWLEAFDRRPGRAEPLVDLARHFRERSKHELAYLFADRASRLTMPQDPGALFVEPAAYDWGARQEIAISGFYASGFSTKMIGENHCWSLSRDRDVPHDVRSLARKNMRFYARSAAITMPTWRAEPLMVPSIGAGWHASTPCIFRRRDGRLWVCQRYVNYLIDAGGRYLMSDLDGVIKTRNFLCALDDLPGMAGMTEIVPWETEVLYTQVQGWEDLRVWENHAGLWAVGCVREGNAGGWCQQILVRLSATGTVEATSVMSAEGRHHKNWVPDPNGRLLVRYDPTEWSRPSEPVGRPLPPIAADDLRGSTPIVAFRDFWLALAHTVVEDGSRRYYHHHWCRFSQEGELEAVGRPFHFVRPGIEYALGAVVDGDRILVSFSINDSDPHIGSVEIGDVLRML